MKQTTGYVRPIRKVLFPQVTFLVVFVVSCDVFGAFLNAAELV